MRLLQVAWATMAAVLAQRGLVTAQQYCAGAPQTYVSWAEAGKAPCAHRVDLRTVTVRAGVVRTAGSRVRMIESGAMC